MEASVDALARTVTMAKRHETLKTGFGPLSTVSL